MPMIVTDHNQPDNPIVFVNQAFHRMTGYTAGEVVGRNRRFMQGAGTDEDTVVQIRAAIAQRPDMARALLDDRQDCRALGSAPLISPVFGPDGDLL